MGHYARALLLTVYKAVGDCNQVNDEPCGNKGCSKQREERFVKSDGVQMQISKQCKGKPNQMQATREMITQPPCKVSYSDEPGTKPGLGDPA